VEGKFKPFIPKWDSLCKHIGHKKVNKHIGTDVKIGDWYYSKVYRHVKNQKLFGSHNYENVVAHVANGVARKRKKRLCNLA
jgi:uncharacterized cysteine cluster protein YcgN (CxxCxxCC family)